MERIFLFLVGHAVCDFVLQGEVMGNGKSRAKNAAGSHGDGFPRWYYWLAAHALTHGGAVYLITGAWWLGALEAGAHAAIDYLKCEGRISFDLDQALHVGCKLAYAAYLV